MILFFIKKTFPALPGGICPLCRGYDGKDSSSALRLRIPAMTKIFLLFLPIAAGFASCASNKINYNVAEPAAQVAALPEKTSMLYGVYRNDLQFRVIAVSDKEGVRVIIMNDMGSKLQDMKITAENGTDIYFIAGFMPKSTIEELEAFFRQYFIDKTKNNIKSVNNKLYLYDEDGEPVLWIGKI
jgi:hypothetical protein